MPQIRKKLLFYGITFSIPVLFFVLIEAGLSLLSYGNDLRLFIPAKVPGNEQYLSTNLHVASRYFPPGYFTPNPPEELFKKLKPANGFRVFVMGGSTVAGWPYPTNVLFSRLLARRLADTFPDRYIEVINTGMAAVNSFTLVDLIDEIIAQKPDAILIYAGHNEFYGAFGAGSTQSIGQSRPLVKAYLALSRLKTFQLVETLVTGAKNMIGEPESPGGPGSETLMEQMIGDSRIAFNSQTYLNARANFEANLSEVLARSRDAGVPVVLSELVSNLRDQPPFLSIDNGGQPSADGLYEKGNKLYAERKFEQAREAYAAAKDLDGLRFRATEDFNASIHKVADRFNVPVVPMEDYFNRASENGVVGHELILEHLHPNVEGYMLISDAFYRTMRQEKLVAASWDEANIKPDSYYRESWPVTLLDRAIGEIRIIHLTDHYPFRPKGANERTVANFTPENIAEDLAVKVLAGKTSFTQAHLTLAKHYDAQGQPMLALRELQALVAAYPYSIDHYLMAGRFLLNRKAYDQALPFLFGALSVNESADANKLIGQILMMKQRPAEARKYLEAAVRQSSQDLQVIYLLGVADVMESKIDSAKSRMDLLMKLGPDSMQVKDLTLKIARFDDEGKE